MYCAVVRKEGSLFTPKGSTQKRALHEIAMGDLIAELAFHSGKAAAMKVIFPRLGGLDRGERIIARIMESPRVKALREEINRREHLFVTCN